MAGARRRALRPMPVALLLGSALMLLAAPAWAAASPYTQTYLWLAIVLVLAKLSGVVERLGLPAVLGELLVGVLLGNLTLLGMGEGVVDAMRQDPFIAFIAQLGVVILLFQVGLETRLDDLKKVGGRATAVALIGVVAPFVLGAFVVGPMVLPELTFSAYLFLGATLTATSVGITGRVFRDMGVLQTPAARIVLGAAVIDDVIGIVILAVVSSMVTVGNVSVGSVTLLIAEAALFLGGAVWIGRIVAQPLARLFAWVHAGVAMKLTLIVAVGLFLAWLAGFIGLAPIIGAFAAGLLLEPAFLKDFEHSEVVEALQPFKSQLPTTQQPAFDAVLEHQRTHHHEQLIEPLGHFMVPVFFVYTGMQVDLTTLSDPRVLLTALALTVAAFVGKIVSGLAAGPNQPWIVGWGMAPRGEVGLIFATVGHELGVVDAQLYSVILVMVVLTTLVTPLVLSWLLKREAAGQTT